MHLKSVQSRLIYDPLEAKDEDDDRLSVYFGTYMALHFNELINIEWTY